MRHTIKILALVLGLGLSACEEPENPSGKFVGTWRATSGTVTTLCPGYEAITDPLNGSLTWAVGVSSDLVGTDPGSACPTLADVNGGTATGLPGQTCSGSDGAGGVYTVSVTSYTFVVSPDGRTATENQSGTLMAVLDGATVVCSVNASGSYQKISN